MQDMKAFQDSMGARLREMGAIIDTLTRRAEALQTEARVQLIAAIQDMRVRQNAIQNQLNQLQHAGTEAAERGMQSAERAIADFDTLVANTARRFESEREVYLAQADAQLRRWSAMIDEYSTHAAERARAGRTEFNRIVDDLRAKQRALQNRFADINNASQNAWQAFKFSFDAARDDLERASTSATSAFGALMGLGEKTKTATQKTGKASGPAASTTARPSRAASGARPKARAAKSARGKSRTAKRGKPGRAGKAKAGAAARPAIRRAAKARSTMAAKAKKATKRKTTRKAKTTKRKTTRRAKKK
ncbi:MAG TPA: hypothetical protein VMV26_18195 [Alphaproteobacteria bacterium]|nr:hypothetical protein [Alphaproteobacteria bacterium]